jgi:hypothetical protein
MEPLVGYRTLQAVSDLQALVRDVLNTAGDGLPFSADEGAALIRLVAEERCVFASDASLSLWPRLAELADDGTVPDETCALSTAVLMANALQGGDRKKAVADLWTGSLDRLRRMPPRYLGPLARAAQCAAARNLVRDDALPTRDDKTTVDERKVSRRLVEIAQSASEEEIVHIARADYGCGCETHLPALRQVIWQQDCVFRDDQGWYPSEVVELVSHVPGETGFAVATAVLLNHCIHKGDLQASTDFRWENNAEAYLALPPPLRDAIIAGFRTIYETDDGWAPYYSALFDPADNRAVLLPPPAPELTRM